MDAVPSPEASVFFPLLRLIGRTKVSSEQGIRWKGEGVAVILAIGLIWEGLGRYLNNTSKLHMSLRDGH